MSDTLRSSISSQAVSDVPRMNSDLTKSAKLKRLRIEENILFKLLHSNSLKEHQDETKKTICSELDFNNYTNKLKRNLNELKKIFADIKDISNEDNLKELDVDDVKKDVMELDSKIRALKTFLSTELITLRSKQENLEQQIEDSVAAAKIIRRRGSASQINKQFVVSPVKNLMTTPLKCSEVQQFQDFMANSSNRYGGWNEYNHLIFVNIWNKTFGENLTMNPIDDGMESSDLFPQFLYEVEQKVLGPTKDDIIDHTRWYRKYLYLKNCQQKALSKWKSKKNKIRKSSATTRSSCYQVQKSKEENTLVSDNSCDASSEESESFIQYLFQTEENIEEINKNNSGSIKYERLNYLKPTKQWTSRSNDDNDMKIAQITYSNVEVIPKMATPNWRLGLR